jgi:hypothetical protein
MLDEILRGELSYSAKYSVFCHNRVIAHCNTNHEADEPRGDT